MEGKDQTGERSKEPSQGIVALGRGHGQRDGARDGLGTRQNGQVGVEQRGGGRGGGGEEALEQEGVLERGEHLRGAKG